MGTQTLRVGSLRRGRLRGRADARLRAREVRPAGGHRRRDLHPPRAPRRAAPDPLPLRDRGGGGGWHCANELTQHLGRILRTSLLGVAAKVISTRPSLPLAMTVLLPRVARVVEPVAVELDRQSVLGPAAVDSVAPGRAVGDGEGEARVARSSKKRASSLLRVTWTSPWMTWRSFFAPGAVGPPREHGLDRAGVVR